MIIAWLVLVAGVLLWNLKPGGGPVESAEVSSEVPTGRLVESQTELAGRLGLGFQQMLPGFPARSQVAALAVGPPADRISHAIFIAAVANLDEGMEELDKVIASSPDDPVVEKFAPLVADVFRSAKKGERPSEQTADTLVERFGWYGRLAVDLGDPDRLGAIERKAFTDAMWMGILIGVMVVAGVLGLVGLVVLLIFALTRESKSRIATPRHHGVYAETFAGWLLLMLLLQYVFAAVSPPETGLLMSVFAFFASLVILAWPVVRGIPWAQVRADIGLEQPRWSDLPVGIASYAMALPFLAIGVVITLVLVLVVQGLTGSSPAPSHPAQQAAVGASTWQVIQLFLLASFAAPVVEETMFRGVFLTHLCGLTRRWMQGISIVFSVLVSSIVFAAIHPQGPIFIPPLAGLAAGFCVARLWRGSLVPAMVAHGVSNALVMGLNVVLFAS
ncbi:MAG: CPBP family intramembrane metalloprotease [Phycisphaera sp.]|nr:CPBP family intramembrane metalloprotease [Phycisphaera sp.]